MNSDGKLNGSISEPGGTSGVAHRIHQTSGREGRDNRKAALRWALRPPTTPSSRPEVTAAMLSLSCSGFKNNSSSVEENKAKDPQATISTSAAHHSRPRMHLRNRAKSQNFIGGENTAPGTSLKIQMRRRKGVPPELWFLRALRLKQEKTEAGSETPGERDGYWKKSRQNSDD